MWSRRNRKHRRRQPLASMTKTTKRRRRSLARHRFPIHCIKSPLTYNDNRLARIRRSKAIRRSPMHSAEHVQKLEKDCFCRLQKTIKRRRRKSVRHLVPSAFSHIDSTGWCFSRPFWSIATDGMMIVTFRLLCLALIGEKITLSSRISFHSLVDLFEHALLYQCVLRLSPFPFMRRSFPT